MKHSFRNLVCFVFILCLFPFSALATPAADLTTDKVEKWVDGNRYIVYPKFVANDPARKETADRLNRYIYNTAHIGEYLQLLPSVQAGGTGLVVSYNQSKSHQFYQGDQRIYSLLITATGKMLQGRPGTVYYPMVLDCNTGDPITFDQLFTDPDGAKAFIEQYMLDVVEPTLSTYLENNQLLPVPWDRFYLPGEGMITFYYDKDQLSFLSGHPGAVTFRFSELWDYLDTSADGIPMQFIGRGYQFDQYSSPSDLSYWKEDVQQKLLLGHIPGLDNFPFGPPSIEWTVEQLKRDYRVTVDSSFYPGGACIEVENPECRGTLLLTDADELNITGILASRVDMYGIITGKTTLQEAKALLGAPDAELPFSQAAADLYLVCPGTAAIYSYQNEFDSVSLTLYADESNVIQYIKLSQN